MKVSPAQIKFLREMPTTAVDSYKPAIALVNLGLAEKTDRTYGSARYERTQAGEDFLASLKQKES